MLKSLQLRSRNPALISAWRTSFAPQIAAGVVEASIGDIFEGDSADAILSPANCFGYMDGGIDAAYLQRFGLGLQARLQATIRDEFFGELHIGQAVVVPTGDTPINWMVSAPTMRVPMDVSRTLNAFTAFRAALIAVAAHNQRNPTQRIASLLSPGICTGIGAMPPTIAARQMRSAWDMIVEGARWVRPEDALRSQVDLLSQ
jgi:O-acetyl-ADP-ribose deacetylase (regulator of RNase III)